MSPVFYAGIGARKTPDEVLVKMEHVAEIFADLGFVLRSGAAAGADSAFEKGCNTNSGAKEIYLPFPGFRGHPSPLNNPTIEARRLAAQFHPNWANLGNVGRLFMARNCYQLLGLSLNQPSSFILSWTPEGAVTGGTGQALRMAEAYSIKVLNFGSMSEQQLEDALNFFVGNGNSWEKTND